MSRRSLLTSGCAALAAAALPMRSQGQERRFEPAVGAWRSFEVTTVVSVPEPHGTTRVWLPVPDVDTAWQKSLGNSWTGNASTVQMVSDPARSVRMVMAEFGPTVGAPTLTLTSRVQTRSRNVDWNDARPVREDPAQLRADLAPTELLPTDGIVRDTAVEITRGAKTDVDKVRAIYEWLVANGYREPKVRGCGLGDIKTILETGNLGGKCADLNAVFVGLARASGIPARDVYGLRVAPSAFGYKELGANPGNLKGAQHCRAEVFLRQYGWVAMDPADVLKVMRQESTEWIRDPKNPMVSPVMRGLFGSWEGNWVAWNTAHDITLPGQAGKDTLPFLMYPQGENADGRFDELSPDTFRYTITSREVTA